MHAMTRCLLVLAILLASCHSRLTYPPGGYPYPDHLTGKDTELYYYPIKDKEPRRDSMRDAQSYAYWRAIGEPNLSLRPMPTDVFRFLYSEALDQTLYVITMTPTGISVRICTPTDVYYNLPDTSMLDTLERKLVRILDRNYPLDRQDPHISTWKRHYLDSLGRRYPQLYDPAYYLMLSKKEFPLTKPRYTFTTKMISLKPDDFKHLVNTVNASGYWHLPPNLPCEEPPMDGWGYQLEVNTASQYNFVGAGSCDPDTSAFTKACQLLVHYAGLDKKINLVSQVDPKTHRTPIVVEPVQLEDVKEEPVKHKHKKLKTPHPN
jgi:hypothetical protein